MAPGEAKRNTTRSIFESGGHGQERDWAGGTMVEPTSAWSFWWALWRSVRSKLRPRTSGGRALISHAEDPISAGSCQGLPVRVPIRPCMRLQLPAQVPGTRLKPHSRVGCWRASLNAGVARRRGARISGKPSTLVIRPIHLISCSGRSVPRFFLLARFVRLGAMAGE